MPALSSGLDSQAGSNIRRDSILVKVPARQRTNLVALTVVLGALGFASVRLLPGVFYKVFPTSDYLVFHTVVEFTSIIVSFVVFTVGWYGYKQNANKQDLVIGVVFLTVGLVDFVHALSYEGMPSFLSPNSTSKACTYWVAARLTDAVGLFLAAFLTATSGRAWLSPRVLASGSLVYVAVLVVTVSYFPNALPAMFIPDVGLTPLKIHLEWTVVAFYAAAVYVFGVRARAEAKVVLLQLALLIAIFSEFSFTLYKSAFDTYSLLGHTYKVAAYYLIFRALFVSSFQRPYHELVEARDQIEQSFSRIGAALASSLQLNEVLQLIAELASDMLRSKYAAVMLLRDGELYILAQRGVSKHPAKASVENTYAGMAVALKRPMTTADVTKINGHAPDCHCQRLDAAAARSIVSAPIMSDEDVLGVVEVYSPEIGAFGPSEAELLSSFARQAAVAIRNSLAYERERTVAETLQRSLLPAAPSIADLDIAVRYVPAEDAARVGGDLYDIFALDDEHLAIAIGDVCGHGLEAASIMAMTVYMIKGFLIHGMSPGEALQHTNLALCRHSRQPTFVTVFLSTFNTRTHEIRYANAGHHAPVILNSDMCELMELHSDLPLAVEESTDYRTHTMDLRGAAGLLFYTDGVVEARRHGDFFGEDRLCRACSELIDRPAGQVLDGVIQQVRTLAAMLQDDIAILAVKWGA